jgi:hypothetical protein
VRATRARQAGFPTADLGRGDPEDPSDVGLRETGVLPELAEPICLHEAPDALERLRMVTCGFRVRGHAPDRNTTRQG